jgi:hypothetical protein
MGRLVKTYRIYPPFRRHALIQIDETTPPHRRCAGIKEETK